MVTILPLRNSSNLDCYIDAKLLDEIVKQQPHNYLLLKLDNWNENTEALVKGMAEIF